MIALLGAVTQETEGLRRKMLLDRVGASGQTPLFKGSYSGKGVLLVRTGPGKALAEMATDWLLEHYPVAAVISFGFAGALAERLGPGDLVVCDRAYCGEGPREKLSVRCDDALVKLANAVRPESAVPSHEGSTVSVARVVSRPEEKRALGQAFGAATVDMESYWVGETASKRGAPFLVVRGVSDSVGQTIPAFDRFLGTDGRWLPGAAAGHFAAHPGELATFPALYRNSRKAARNLVSFLDLLIRRI